MTGDTADNPPRPAARKGDEATGYVWRCHKCGHYIGTIERLDGALVVLHKCGATNRLAGVLTQAVDCRA